MQFCSLVFALAQLQNLCHTQTDMFAKIVKSCLKHPKMCKSAHIHKFKKDDYFDAICING